MQKRVAVRLRMGLIQEVRMLVDVADDFAIHCRSCCQQISPNQKPCVLVAVLYQENIAIEKIDNIPFVNLFIFLVI